MTLLQLWQNGESNYVKFRIKCIIDSFRFFNLNSLFDHKTLFSIGIGLLPCRHTEERNSLFSGLREGLHWFFYILEDSQWNWLLHRRQLVTLTVLKFARRRFLKQIISGVLMRFVVIAFTLVGVLQSIHWLMLCHLLLLRLLGVWAQVTCFAPLHVSSRRYAFLACGSLQAKTLIDVIFKLFESDKHNWQIVNWMRPCCSLDYLIAN